MLNRYLELVKPERTLTNVLTAAAGYLYASRWHINWRAFTALLAVSTLIIASACVFNNLIDRRLDAKMARTKKRALVNRQVPVSAAILYGILLGALGLAGLALTNRLTLILGIIAFITYVLLYGWAKRYTVHSTLIGTVPGGASVVAGYTTVTNRLDLAALLLFIMMLTWQMAHFYAIGIYRVKDYAAAGLPVLPVKKGMANAKVQIFFYAVLMLVAAVLLTILGYAGYVFMVVMLIIGTVWLKQIWQGFKAADNTIWARDVFLFSLKVVTVFAIILALARTLP